MTAIERALKRTKLDELQQRRKSDIAAQWGLPAALIDDTCTIVTYGRYGQYEFENALSELPSGAQQCLRMAEARFDHDTERFRVVFKFSEKGALAIEEHCHALEPVIDSGEHDLELVSESVHMLRCLCCCRCWIVKEGFYPAALRDIAVKKLL
jgi:hypothetical protein